ncbi:Nbr1-like protein [Thalictrum thalictroides]|uniref:Nbr1-like protein n=1 Tax=Thalictrum thalictroides TaxID=46969 RepID=A0A7J6W2I7_THATH|nr:Nbr1-like protein [Thalictrum thalictroides]
MSSKKLNTEIVIKVNYGDILRRFSVLFNQDGSLGLDVSGLRAKIFDLFKFAPDADITLTYVDEDNDRVTLVDDADLRDAIKQRLDPLRITVFMKSDSAQKLNQTGSSISYPRGSTTAVRRNSVPFNRLKQPLPTPLVGRFIPRIAAPAEQQPSHEGSSSSEGLPVQQQLLSRLVCDLASTVASHAPERYCDFISKLSHDVSKAIAPPAPLISELVDILSKLGTSHKEPASKHHVDMDEKPSEDLEKSECGTSNGNQNISKAPVTSGNGEVSSAAKNFIPSDLTTGGNRKECEINPPGCQVAADGSFCSSPSTTIPSQYNWCSSQGFPSTPPLAPVNNDAITAQLIASASTTDPFGENMPYGGIYAPRRIKNCENMGRAFHQGVRCDGCGVHPITGPRFKSKVKEDYDLCCICFAELGDEADYIRMDRPNCYRAQRFPKFQHPRFERSPLLPHGVRSAGFSSAFRSKKIDSRFIEDVNIVDGTLMAPLTPFTKIWRMHNNGAVVWPRGTQLVWIAGVKLTNRESFEVELPSEGGLMGTDLDIAIDFTAPEQPGQYVSYWRMATPYGQEFGQCVWVLIQVDTQRVSRSTGRNLNLNLPPDSGDAKDLIIDVNVEPLDSSHPSPHSNMAAELVQPIADGCSNKKVDALCINGGIVNCNENSISVTPELPAAVSYPTIDFSAGSYAQDPEVSAAESYPTIDISAGSYAQSPKVPAAEAYPTIDVSAGSYAQAPGVRAAELYPKVDISDIPTAPTPEVPASENYPFIDFSFSEVQPASTPFNDTLRGQVSNHNSLEQSLLKELEEMGFKEIDLNKEILRANEYDLDRALDDLCDVAEWDPMLEELQEMGFNDKETNKKLLIKNGGSIKRVVMDLIAAEKA